MGDRLAFLYQRSQYVIHPLDAFWCLVNSFPAGGQKFPVAVIRIFGGIELLIHLAVHTLTAAVTYIRSFIQTSALLGAVFFTDITASERTAHPAGHIAVHISAGMFEHTSGVYVRISLTWNVSITIEFFNLCMFTNLLGYRCRVFMDLPTDFSKRKAIVKTFLDPDTVRQC